MFTLWRAVLVTPRWRVNKHPNLILILFIPPIILNQSHSPTKTHNRLTNSTWILNNSCTVCNSTAWCVFIGEMFSQMKHQLDVTLCRFYFCSVTLHVSGASSHHQEYLKIVQRPVVHVTVAAVLVLNTPDDGRLRPKHVEWPCRDKTCTVLHQVGVSFEAQN